MLIDEKLNRDRGGNKMTKLSDEFHNAYTKNNIYADKSRSGRLAFIMQDLSLENKSVLDIGCGPGVQFGEYTKRNSFTGIDISSDALELAAQNGYAVHLGDVSKELPFSDESFDVVVLTDILEHVVEPLELLKEAARVLKADGHAIISLPNHFFLSQRIAIMLGRGLVLAWENHQEFQDWNYFHLRFLRSTSVSSLTRSANFKLIVDYSGRFPAPLSGYLGFPGLSHTLRAIRRMTIARYPDLWTLHFLGIYRKNSSDSVASQLLVE